jgi:hypothetical protein
MDKSQLKTAILEVIGAELDQWLDTKDSLKTGYEWETTLVGHAQKINQLIIQHSLGDVPKNRNKKKLHQFRQGRNS